MYKVVPSDKLVELLNLMQNLTDTFEEVHDTARTCTEQFGHPEHLEPCETCRQLRDARTSLEWWAHIQERSNQAEEDIQHLADTAQGLLDVVDRLESALDIRIPEASKLHEAIALVNEAFPADREGQDEER